MNCNDAKIALHAYIDEELSSTEAQQLKEHIESCADCSEEYSQLIHLRNSIKPNELYTTTPSHLENSISIKLDNLDKNLSNSENKTSFWSSLTPKLIYSLPALFLGLVIGWTGFSQFQSQQNYNGLLQSLASAHIHSLMANHLTDVASSDSHTVKPWFHGRLDFSPPVQDFTQQGFPLIGGRLEYLAESPAAALVYRHRQHSINLFIAPEPSQPVKPESSAYNGYHILYWNKGGLSFWAVSDLNLANLEDFRKLQLSGAR